MALTLTFSLGEALYGLEIDNIQEIIEAPVRHYVPFAKAALSGAINFHGQVLPTIDLPALLGIADERRSDRFLVLTPEHHSLVLSVSGVERIIDLDLAGIQPPPASASGMAVRGVAEHEGLRVNLLDNEAINLLLENLHT